MALVHSSDLSSGWPCKSAGSPGTLSFFIRPVSQIDEFAAAGAKRTIGVVLRPGTFFSAGWAGNIFFICRHGGYFRIQELQ